MASTPLITSFVIISMISALKEENDEKHLPRTLFVNGKSNGNDMFEIILKLRRYKCFELYCYSECFTNVKNTKWNR